LPCVVLHGALQIIRAELNRAHIDIPGPSIANWNNTSNLQDTLDNSETAPVQPSTAAEFFPPETYPLESTFSNAFQTTSLDDLQIYDMDFTPEVLEMFSQLEPIAANVGGDLGYPITS
jgi:hypothetical protein